MKSFRVVKSITNRENEIFNTYLRDVARIPTITRKEEIELAKLIKQGDEKAKTKLINANLRFVISVAKQYQNQGLDLIDLINEGNYGLIKAAEKFDETRGFKFISYAVWWIRQSILKALADLSRTIRLPINQSMALNKVLKAINEFEQKYERKPSNAEIAKMTDLDASKIDALLNSNAKCVAVETPFGDEDEGCLLDVIPNKDSPAGDSIVKIEDASKSLDLLLQKLTIREADILILFFGLKGVQAMPYETIGNLYGLTGERIRQICNKTLEKIRKNYPMLAKDIV